MNSKLSIICKFVSSKNKDKNGIIRPIPTSSKIVWSIVKNKIKDKIDPCPLGRINITFLIKFFNLC